MSDDAELARIAALTAEHLRWEMELGVRGLPDLRGVVAAAEPAAAGGLPPTPSREREGGPSLDVLAQEAAACTACGLHAGRTKSVFARGSASASLMFVGEGPGYHEDQSGLPFVGKAGQLLDKMIAAMGFGPDEIYICNVVKCRPPDNRTPKPDEASECMPFLRQQIALVQPRVIVALGRCAAENLGAAEPGRRWRGMWGRFEGVPVMPTYHPAYLLRTPEQKRPVWQDLQAVVSEMGRELPERR